MLDIKITIQGDKVVIEDLNRIAKEFPNAVKRGLKRSARGIYAIANQWLSGPAATYESRTSKSGKTYRKKTGDLAGGGYPVPVRTGHLRQSLAWLDPGESKSGDVGTFTAGEDEVVIFDSASYAPAIFLGRGSSTAYGPRDALRDALDLFNHGANIQRVIEEEIVKEINKNK